MATFWQILTAIAPILAPVVSLVLVLIGRVIWNHEKRLRTLEDSATRHGRSLYGDDNDVQQTGLAHDMRDVVNRLERLETKIDQLNDSYDEPEFEESE